MNKELNHYQFIDKYGGIFSKRLGLRYSISNLSSAHGDKAYCYRSKWTENGIPFNHGVCIFLMSYMREYDDVEVGNTPNGYIPVVDWVIKKYKEIQSIFDDME